MCFVLFVSFHFSVQDQLHESTNFFRKNFPKKKLQKNTEKKASKRKKNKEKKRMRYITQKKKEKQRKKNISGNFFRKIFHFLVQDQLHQNSFSISILHQKCVIQFR